MGTDKLMEIVDNFVEHYYNGDYVVDCLSSFVESRLADALRLYVEAKSDNVNDKLIRERAKKCLEGITEVRRLNAVKETQTLVTKLKKAIELLKEADEENSQLRDENAGLQKEVLRLKKLNEELHKAFERLGAKKLDNGSKEG